MSGFSTIGGGASGSSQQVNFTITTAASGTLLALYTTNNIVDVAGLLVAIENTSGAAITLTVPGSIVNTASFPTSTTVNSVTIPASNTLVIETNLANLDYYVVSTSSVSGIAGGATGNLLYQSAPNVTSFLATGAAGLFLGSNGAATPLWAAPTVSTLQGGAAGEILYQSAPSVTDFVPAGTSGQVLVSNGAAAPSWATLSGFGGTIINNAGATITFTTPREFTANLGGYTSGITLGALYTALGLTNLDGDVMTVYNNTANTFQLNLQNVTNPNSWTNGTSFLAGSVIYIYPNQSVTIQTFVASTNTYTICSTSQTQSVGFFATLGAMGNPPAADTLINYVSSNDPQGWFNNGAHSWTVQRKGLYFVEASITINYAAVAGTSANIQIRQNGTQISIGFGTPNTNSQFGATTIRAFAMLGLNPGDVVTATVYVGNGLYPVVTGNASTFTGMLIK